MKVVLLTTDNRECYKNYEPVLPYFGFGVQRLIDGFSLLDGVDIHVVSCSKKKVSAPEKLASNIWFHSLVVPSIGWLRTAYSGCVVAARKKVKELCPDIVHGQGTERDCALSAILSGYPNVITIHGNMRRISDLYKSRPFSYLWITARLEEFVLSRADGVICLSTYTRNNVQPGAKRTWLIPNAISVDFASINHDAEKEPVILCVGTICYHKNQQALVRALAPLAEKRNLRLIFIGDSAADAYARDFVRLIEGKSWCVCKGFSNQSEVAEYMRTSTLLAIPSLEDNCPNVVLEAMAAGLPVAGAAIGGIPDLVRDGVTGLLFDPRNEDDIRNKVAAMLDNPPLASAMSAEARRLALSHYHPSSIAKQHVSVYNEVIQARKERRQR